MVYETTQHTSSELRARNHTARRLTAVLLHETMAKETTVPSCRSMVVT